MRGNPCDSTQVMAQYGLSPRMRGNHYALTPRVPPPGSIPAHAGEPPSPYVPAGEIEVYPRACGGTPKMCCSAKWAAGSIPAHAGEPLAQLVVRFVGGVYPRACGGTGRYNMCSNYAGGLSPRMRGNRRHWAALGSRHGSIPAHAGEPHQVPFAYRSLAVYPRACGGTSHNSNNVPYIANGVYPRACGGTTLVEASFQDGTLKSGLSPAHAGEPCFAQDASISAQKRSIPAPCGGTDHFSGRFRRASSHGSIPAHAGEPLWR